MLLSRTHHNLYDSEPGMTHLPSTHLKQDVSSVTTFCRQKWHDAHCLHPSPWMSLQYTLSRDDWKGFREVYSSSWCAWVKL